ncbi:GntR family transcriptional regulator [uncultured Hydrogenophaga sp.]|uniref:GntR family transcriptional regulator n=1 Tax=uncultured Hydrogenophaga sp. TaxID=199683 RepID=UPI0025882151|nr:GntR family transcriptional regulator [uncultured Hydrogenophaga sp.]
MARASTTTAATHRRPRAAAKKSAQSSETKPNLGELAYSKLEELIVTCQIPPGSVHLANGLAERIGIGRTPVRDAINRLAREGMVRVVPRVGVVVAEVNVEDQLKLLELRREIERFLVRCAAKRANASEREAFSVLQTSMKEALKRKDIVLFARADYEFNDLVRVASRNELAADTMQPLQSRARRYWYLHHRGQLSERGVQCHIDIAGAIARGDPDAAAAASDSLMDYIQEYTRAALPTF